MYPSQFIFVLFFSINIHYTVGSADSLDTRVAAAREDDSEYFYNFIQSMENVYGELRKLRDGGKINSNNIRVINANIFIMDTTENDLDNLITKNLNDITYLRNYLRNSADEYNIQAIKKIFTLYKVDVDDIIGVRVKPNRGADFYYFKQKQ